MELAYETFGSGRPVIVLHGLFASSESWRGLARGLSDKYRVICVDLPNHGRSPASDSMDYENMAADVLSLMAGEVKGPAAVIGHCIGGKVAMAMALTVPRAVRKLCVIETAPTTFLDPWMHQLRSMRRSLAVNGGSAALAASKAAASGSLLNQFMLPPAAIKNAYIDWRCNLAAIAPLIPELREFPTALQERRCALTLHAFLGAESAFVRPADASSFQPMFPKTRVNVIDSASHWVHAVRAEALLAGLRSVLDSMPEDAVA
jgi:pimeloyl-ACP methyl ester carboxylesterase